eukprot:gene50936-29605_t
MAALRRARTDVSSPANLRRWSAVASGVSWLEYAATCSVIKVLPHARQIPKRAVASWRLRLQELTEDDGVLSRSDKVRAGGHLAAMVVGNVLLAWVGVLALLLKLESIRFLFDEPIDEWGRQRW